MSIFTADDIPPYPPADPHEPVLRPREFWPARDSALDAPCRICGREVCACDWDGLDIHSAQRGTP